MYKTMATLASKITHLMGWGWRISEYASQGKYMAPESSANHSLVGGATCGGNEQIREATSRAGMQEADQLLGKFVEIFVDQPEQPEP
jgi:hypothetical protein